MAAESVDLTPLDHLKVMNVIGETSVQVTNQAQSFQWKGYGIKLHVPQGTLPAGFKQCDVLIKVAVSGEFRLPHYTTLVSAVYWIDCKPQCEFAKPVVLELQHCASPSQTNKLSFAKCSLNALPPYMFEILEGGEFDNQSAYGRIELRSFSLITQLLRSTPLLTGIVKQDNKHHARVFYLWKSEELREIHFVLTKALEAHATVVNQEYTARGGTIGPHLPIVFGANSISLELPSENDSLSGWKLLSLFPPVITKEDVDSFGAGHNFPHCEIIAEWTAQGKPSRLKQKVPLKGAKEPYNYFYIVLDTTPPSKMDQLRIFQCDKIDDTALDEHSLKTIMDSISTIAARWFGLGVTLGLTSGKLMQIECDQRGDSYRCLAGVITEWLQNDCKPSWRSLAMALSSRSLDRNDIATMIAQEHAL